jgi:hypothetical protein
VQQIAGGRIVVEGFSMNVLHPIIDRHPSYRGCELKSYSIEIHVLE